MSDDLGFQPAAAQDDIGFQPAPVAPKLPDTAPVVAMVHQNLAAQPAPTPNTQPQTDAQKLDAGLGFQVSAALNGGDGTLPAVARQGLVQAYKDGTATTAGDYAQSVLPAAALASSGDAGGWLNQKYLAVQKSIAEAAAQTLSGTAVGAEMIGRAIGAPSVDDAWLKNFAGAIQASIKTDFPALPQTGGNEVAGTIGAIAPAILYPPLAIPYFGVSGMGQAKDNIDQNFPNAPQSAQDINVLAKGGINTLQNFIPGLKEVPADAMNGVMGYAARTLKASGMGGSVFAGISAINDAIDKYTIDPNKVIGEGALHQGAVGFMTGGLIHGLVVEPMMSAGHSALAPVVADAVGKPAEQVTPQDINQVIDKAFTPPNPKAQDFHDVAAVMADRTNYITPQTHQAIVDTLHQTYAETGIHPDQVWEDAKNNPNIAADIQAGRVPDAYEDLKAKPEPNAEGMSSLNVMTGEITHPEEPAEKPTEKPWQPVAQSLLPEGTKLSDDRTVDPSIVQDKDTVNYQAPDQTKEQIFAKAEADKPAYQDFIKSVTDGVDGAEPYAKGVGGDGGVRVKNQEGRIDEKIAEKDGNASAISDYLGGAIEVKTPEALNQVMENIRASGAKVIEVDDMLSRDDKSKDDGYRAIHLQIDRGNGLSAELQLLPEGVADIKEKLHPAYAKLRDEDTSAPAAEAARKKMESAYGKAYQRFITTPDARLYNHPKEPLRLLQWIKRQGGVRDDGGTVSSEGLLGANKDVRSGGGDVAASIGGVRGLPGLIRKNGVEITELARRAHEEGFLSPVSVDDAYKAKASEQVDLKNRMIDAIREDHNGEPQYRDQDANDVLDYKEAMKRNEEVDRISSDTGIPTEGETYKSFWNKVAEHMSVEQQIEEMRSMYDAHIYALREADQAARDYMESRGDSFEGIEEGKPATLEELDAERAKEIAARGDEAFPQRHERSEPADGRSDEVQEGGGRGGRGTEPPRGGSGRGFDDPKEGPLTQPPGLKDPRLFEDQLHQIETNVRADKLDVLKRAEAMPDLPSETWEKLYAYDENDPNAKLTPEEQAIYDEHIKPLKELDDKLYQHLEGLVGEVELGAEEGHFQRGYTPRYVKGRTRSFGEMLEQAKNGVVAKFGGAAGRSMRKTVDAQKSRRYYNAVDPTTGTKKLIYIDKEHNVIAFDKDKKGVKIGKFVAGQKLAPGSEVNIKAGDGKNYKWKLDTALTREIEGATNQRYLKNVAANRLDLTAKLQSAVRNAEFIEAMKGAPEFDDVAIPVGVHNSVIPETDGRAWRTPKMLQFRNYYMEPKLADALDDFARSMQLDGVGESLNRIGRVMMNVMFLNPKAHIDNIFNHMIVQGGLVGNIYHLPSTAMSLIKSFRDVYNVSDDYMANLRAGASLKHAETLTSDLHQKLIEKLGIDAEKDPKAWDGLARAFGYNDTKTMLSRFAGVGQRAMWFASDVMTNARMEQERMLGKSRPDAIADVEKHMPNYRVPGQVMGSRTIAEALKNPLWTMFGKYDFGRLKSYAYLLKEGFGKDASLIDRAKSFDRMAMIVMYATVIYPALDKMWQEITGDNNASVVRSGASTIPQIGMDVANGNKSIGDAVQSIMPIGIPVQLASDFSTGRYGWSGEPIIHQSDVNHGRSQAGYDALNYLGSKLSYIGQVGNVAQGKMSGSQMGYGALGVKTPTDQQIKERAYYKAREDTKAAQRASRLQKQRNSR